MSAVIFVIPGMRRHWKLYLSNLDFERKRFMKEFTYKICDELGIHARPAGLLVKKASEFSSEITIYKDESLRFDEVNCEALYCLPIKDVQIIASSLPKEVVIKGYDGKIESKIKVESVTYIYEKEFTSQLKITVSGTKTYGSSSSYDMIKYKIYDSKKFVVEDGIFYLSSLSSGDKFKDDSIVIYDVIPGETYSIDFFEYY